MKIAILGAPSTGKSALARALSAELIREGSSCDLIPDYASQYIQQAGLPASPADQLVIGIGQYFAEQRDAADYVVTDAAAFATYIYAQRSIPKETDGDSWPKDRALLDVLQTIARLSVSSYDLILLLTHVFPPRDDGTKAPQHLSVEECQEISRDIEQYLTSERAPFHKLRGNDPEVVAKARRVIGQHSLIQIT